MAKKYYVYILANWRRVLYVGVTDDIARRVEQHREHQAPGFTSRYGITRLVHVETYDDVRTAIEREKQIKAWRRAKKVGLIDGQNPRWRDLAEDWFGASG